jgi:hypothetical protein
MKNGSIHKRIDTRVVSEILVQEIIRFLLEAGAGINEPLCLIIRTFHRQQAMAA